MLVITRSDSDVVISSYKCLLVWCKHSFREIATCFVVPTRSRYDEIMNTTIPQHYPHSVNNKNTLLHK